MGGHGHHISGNPNNVKEDDSELSSKIRSIELIKHNPQLFHLEFNLANSLDLAGGPKTLGFAALMGFLSLTYFKAGMRTRP